MQKHKSFYTILLISVVVLVFARCLNGGKQGKDVRGEQFAGSEACVSCHKNVAGSYAHTAHYKTSAPAADSALLRLYQTSPDTFSFPTETMIVEKSTDGFYQAAYRNGGLLNRQRFDIAIGSGEKAQTYAYWKEHLLYQLPLSYFNAVPGWANSPGFPMDKPHFDRAIISRCFECHGSYIETEDIKETRLSAAEPFIPSSVIYGIDCERCHGPAAKHVAYQQNNPSAKKAKYITRWATLSRQQKLDACAVCHSGNDAAMQTSTFLFQPGDTLANFYFPQFRSASQTLDVHGKQMQLLAASACFQKSKALDCTTCHSPHGAEQRNSAILSQRCLSCHQPSANKFCKLANQVGAAITQNCIDCHMPEQASKSITFQNAGQSQTTPYFLRTHTIAIYPDETSKVIRYLKGLPEHEIQRN